MIRINDNECRFMNNKGATILLRKKFWRIEDAAEESVKLIAISNDDRETIIAMLEEIAEELSKDERTCKTMSFQYKGVYATLHSDGRLFLNIQEEVKATFHK